MRVFIIIQIFIIIQTEIRLSSKCDFHIADRICFAGVDISEHLVCVAKEHASWHKHFARNKFDSAKRTFAATAAYVDSDACSFKRTQNGFIAFCVDNLVAYFEFENLCSAQFLRKTRFVLNVLACAEHLAADIATKRKYFSGLTIWLWQSSKRTAMAHAIKSKQFSKTVSKTSINTALTIRYIDSLSQNTHKLRLTGCNRNL